MQQQLEEAIVRKARAVMRRHRIESAAQLKYADRYQKRTGLAAGAPDTSAPAWWTLHPHFDPRYCISHAPFLARVIWKKVQNGTYEPVPAIQFDVPKPDGTSRQIMAFAIPDAALANIVHRNATRRNINIFSSYSFAYRPDKGIFDAILNLKRAIRGPKSYIVQYDFSKYFDTIEHSFVRRLLDRRLFLLSSAEMNVINAFLQHDYCTMADYSFGQFEVRQTGVPQGSSLSLFLSNAAAHDLDLSLERQNGSFVRFADDVVAITHTYTDAIEVAAQFRGHCKDAGLKINYEKSPGILILGGGPEIERRQFVIDTDDVSDIKTIQFIDYLGHRVYSANEVGIPAKGVKKIKRRIAEIVYKHLLLHRRGPKGSFNPSRIGHGFVDWDLVTCINEVRKYIYGGLQEAQVFSFINDNAKLPHVRGLMAFFPLVTRIEELRELDGWLLSIIMRAQRERVKVLLAHGHVLPRLSREQLVSGKWYGFDPVKVDMTLPSFVRSWRAARKYYKRYGLKGIQQPSYYSMIGYS